MIAGGQRSRYPFQSTMKTMNTRKKKHKLNAEIAFAQVEKMLYKLAWDAARAYKLEYEDCLSECYYAFVKAFNWRYDASKGTKFSTVVFTIAKWRLQNLMRTRNSQAPMEELNEETAGFAPITRSVALEILGDLSEDAQEIVLLLVNTPPEIAAEVTTPKRLLSKVKQHLREQGRSKQDLEQAHLEIEVTFQALWKGQYEQRAVLN